ncbi:MAG: hypothetical protein KBI47_20165, partial [Armatimonadetes bacterium]|nr:hypothetical protein [Armatimonadota bacterium]
NGVWAIEVHPGVTSAQINAIEQAVKFHAPERLVVGLFNAEGTWAGSDYELEDPSPAEVAGALRRAQASLVAAEALKKSRPVKGHTRKTPSGKLALIPPHMDKRDPARPEQSTQNAPLAASQPPTYNKRVADNLKHMGAPDGWRSLAIVGMDEGKDLKKKRAMVPQFEPIPEGYTTAPSLYLPSGGIGEQVSIGFGVGATCELCGKQGIKFRYPVVHDGKKWVMWVGSECVTTFGEASGKQQERDHQKDARKSIVLELRDMARQIVQAFADGDRFGRDRNTHPNPSACYDIWNKLNALGRSVTLFGIDTDKEGMAETDRQLQAWLRKNEGYIAALKAAFADLMAMREFRVPLSPDEQKIADKAAATYNEAIAIANAPDTGHGTRFRETIASILRMLGGMSAEDYGYRIVIGQRDKTVQSTHQTLTTQVKQWNAYNGVPVKKGLASLFKSRPVKGHTRKTESGRLTLVAPHMDKRDPAKPKQTKPRAKAQPKLRTPGIKTSAFEMDERKLSALTERVKKLNAAAKRLGIQPITMEITGERWDEAPGRFPAPGMPPEMIPVKMLSVRISGPEPTLADWEFAAVVTPEGNKHLIRKMGDGEDVPTRYRSTRSGKRMYCEHCNSSRARKKCFILRNTETGEYKMVGSTCIGDFLGHAAGNAEKLAEWYEGFAYLDDYEGAADEADMGDDGFDRPGHYVSAEKYLAHVVALIEQNGWTSRSARYDDSGMATADQALINMIDERKRDDTIPVTEKHWKKARAVRKWLKGLKKEDLTSDYLYNLSVVGKEPAVSMNGIGILASAVVAYEKAKGEELSKKKAAKGEGPKHVGTVGERSTFDVTVVREHVTEGFYGTTYIYGLEDQDGNKLTWFASNPVLEQGQRVKLLATVKAHDEYKGVPQTVITRAKVVEEGKLKKALGWLRKALVRAHPMHTPSGGVTMRRQHSRKGQAQGDPLRQRMDSLGTTDDMQRAAFLTPDGRMVDGGSRGNLLVRNARDEHENLVYWVATGEQPKSAGTDMRLYEAVRKEHFPAVRRAGYMRVNFRPNGVWAIEVHPGVTSAQINAIEQAVKFHAPERLVVGLFNAEGTWAGSDYELEDPSPAEAAGALRRAQASLVAAKPLQKSRTVRAHQMHTAAGITVRREHTDKRPAAKQRLNARPIQVYRGMSSAEYWKWVDAGLIPKSKHGASSGMAGWAEEHSKFGKNDILVSFLAPKGTLRRGDADGHWITHEAIPLDRAMLQVVSGDLKPRSEIEASLSAIKNARKRLYAAIKPGAILRGHGSGIWRDFIVYEKKGRRFVIGPYVPDGYQVADLTSRHRPSD